MFLYTVYVGVPSQDTAEWLGIPLA